MGGDIILQIDYNTSFVRDNEAFVEYLENEKMVGENVIFTIGRDGEIGEINLTLDALTELLWYIDLDEGIKIKYPSN